MVAQRARAGVDVRILLPDEHTDAKLIRLTSHHYFEDLLAAGVKIYEYQPTMMHSKYIVVDGKWSVVGSANMDVRSIELNVENVLGILDEGFARRMEATFLEDLKRSQRVPPRGVAPARDVGEGQGVAGVPPRRAVLIGSSSPAPGRPRARWPARGSGSRWRPGSGAVPAPVPRADGPARPGCRPRGWCPRRRRGAGSGTRCGRRPRRPRAAPRDRRPGSSPSPRGCAGTAPARCTSAGRPTRVRQRAVAGSGSPPRRAGLVAAAPPGAPCAPRANGLAFSQVSSKCGAQW